MKKIFIVLWLIFLFVFLAKNSLALSPAYFHVCKIEGLITNIEYEKAKCTGSIGQQICHPDRYLIDVEIKKSSLVRSADVEGSCEERYAVGTIHEISLPKDLVEKGDIIAQSLVIEGEIYDSFGTSFSSYSIEKSELYQSTDNKNLLIGIVSLIIIVVLIIGLIFLKIRK